MSHKTINILQEKTPTVNGSAFTCPLYANRKKLNDMNMKLNFFDRPSGPLFDCDVLLVTSKFAKENQWWKEDLKPEMFAFLKKAKEGVDEIIWVDLSDSAGTTHFEVLPYVDRYLKGSVLKDRREYQRFLYGSRYYTDYYNTEFGVVDEDPGEPHLNHCPDDSGLRKIYVGWNSALFNYSYHGNIFRKLNAHIGFLPVIYFKDWKSPYGNRAGLLSCRITADYKRNSVAFQRRRVLELLNGRLQAGRVDIARYFKELENSKTGISPFGWGEICYRDFEIIISGAALIKPDCGHMETWPDLYLKNETYVPFRWDFSDFDDLIGSLPGREKELIEIARKAQEVYAYHLFSDEGRNEFCRRFISLISFENINTNFNTPLYPSQEGSKDKVPSWEGKGVGN
ncbi:MAG: hypothetical protein HZA16_06675 [Nitrospirae bacterium]|nr:hypothetical protein [Nitrospirota bacterium]